MKLLVQFPTFNRPQKFVNCLRQYVETCSGKNQIFFNINCDLQDLTMTDPDVIRRVEYILSKKDNVDGKIWFDKNTEKISAINDHIEHADFDIVICASDDMIPKAWNWDVEIVNAMDQNFPDLDGCVHFNDGNTNGELITFSILGRKLYEHFGYIYHPDYKSLYCDDEFTQEVKRMGKEKYIDKVIISHEHYSLKGSQNDGDLDLATKKTLVYSSRDQQVFNTRKKLGFPRQRITND